MKHLRLREWGFAARLMAIAFVPASLMLVVVNLWMYSVARDEVAADIRERGRIISAALAQACQYGVISDDRALLGRAVRAMLATDPSVVMISVLDASGQALVTEQRAAVVRDAQSFEVPVEVGGLDIDLFDAATGPHASFDGSGSGLPRVTAPAGRVRVLMSAEPLLAAKLQRLYVGSSVVLFAALVSAAIGWTFATRIRRPLDAVMSALRSIRRGRFDVQLDTRASGEMGELQTAILEMAESLGSTQTRLEGQVLERTAQLEQALELARATDAQMRRLIASGNALVEEERRRISREIHDDLNAALVSVKLQATALAEDAEIGRYQDLRAAAERIASGIDQLYLRARDIVKQLRPEVIDALGLPGAIEEMVRHLDEVHPQCTFTLTVGRKLPAVGEQAAIAGYRIVQEALANVVKHAAANSCNVAVTALPGTATLEVVIIDDGRGFDAETLNRTGLGIVGMRERISAIEGALRIDSTPGRGTAVTIHLPALS